MPAAPAKAGESHYSVKLEKRIDPLVIDDDDHVIPQMKTYEKRGEKKSQAIKSRLSQFNTDPITTKCAVA